MPPPARFTATAVEGVPVGLAALTCTSKIGANETIPAIIVSTSVSETILFHVFGVFIEFLSLKLHTAPTVWLHITAYTN